MKKQLLLVLSFFIFGYAYAENDKAFFWQVTPGQSVSNQATVYLMGSIHFADKTFYPLRSEIEEAFDRSKYLVVELDVDALDPDSYNQLILKKGVYKDGTTIKDAVTEETWQKLNQRLHQLNLPYEAVKFYKPGVLVLTMTAIQVMQMGLEPEMGIDVHFLKKAQKPPRKQIVELETLEQQVNLFLDIPNGDLLLKESLYSMDEAELQMAEMVDYWKKGDDDNMNKLLFEDALDEYPAFSAIYDRLFFERNRLMLAKIDDMLKQDSAEKTSYFVVVGTGHLVGEKGIVNELKEKGYRVKRL
jgi:uncharacterized protein YbaP (TraB family)